MAYNVIMFTTLRKFIIIFLALLQLIAPLVHAHAGEDISNTGLHVPGLEMYSADHDTQMSQAISHDGVMIGVDVGMKDKKMNADLTNSHYLPQQISVFNPALSPFDHNFTPQAQQFICRLFIPSLSPRAPPAPKLRFQ